MRKISLFIAMSLDGYIADSEGKILWLTGQGNDGEDIDVYSEFIKDVDTVFMGRKTYDQIVTELSPDQWVYEELTAYVFTHKQKESSEKIRFTDQNPIELVRKLKEEKGKDIWICGGADLAQQFIKEDMIDHYYITVIPTLLGSGVRLFENGGQEIPLRLIHTKSYNGMVDLVYVRR